LISSSAVFQNYCFYSHDIAKLLLKVALNTITLTTTLTLIYNDEIIFININYFKSGNLINGLFLVNLYLFLNCLGSYQSNYHTAMATPSIRANQNEKKENRKN
jgi:hypothetical protein